MLFLPEWHLRKHEDLSFRILRTPCPSRSISSLIGRQSLHSFLLSCSVQIYDVDGRGGRNCPVTPDCTTANTTHLWAVGSLVSYNSPRHSRLHRRNVTPDLIKWETKCHPFRHLFPYLYIYLYPPLSLRLTPALRWYIIMQGNLSEKLGGKGEKEKLKRNKLDPEIDEFKMAPRFMYLL